MVVKTEKRAPVLRFPMFNEDWKERSLGYFLSFKNGINARKEQYGKGIKFINVLDILNNDYITYDRIIGLVDIDEATFLKNIVSYGDILFQRSSETREDVGLANVYLDQEKNATFGGFVIRGQRIKDYHPVFMNFLLKTGMARKEITSKSGGSTRYNVGQEVLSSVRIILPSLPEQQKIASFLTTIDTRIQQLSRKLELLEQYKKGVMQQIFSQEIRFKPDSRAGSDEEGRDFPEWEEKKLGNFIQEFKKKSSTNNQHEVLTSSNKGLIRQVEYFGSNRITERENKGFNIIPPNYVTYRSRSDNRRFTFNLNTLGITGIISTYYPVFSFGNGTNQFFVELLNFHKHYLGKYAVGTSQVVLSINELKKVKFSMPSIPEQQKIADFLIAIDQKINLTKDQLNQTQTFKKGLLQQMFV